LAFGVVHPGPRIRPISILYKSTARGVFHTIKTRQKSDDFEAPDAINWPTLFFFWGKVILTVIAHCALLYGIGEQLFGLQQLVRPDRERTAATRASRKSSPRSRRNRIDKLRREFVR